MKKRKEIVTQLKVVMEGGAAISAATTHQLNELRSIFANATKSKGEAVIDTVNNEEEVEDDMLSINTNKMLFWLAATPNKSPIVVPQVQTPRDLRIQ